MADWFDSLLRGAELVVGWMFSSSWLPPKDFEFFRWLVVPGYGYGFLILFFAALEFLRPQDKRPWTRASLLSGTYLIFAAKIGFYSLLISPAIRNAWVYLGLPSLHLDRSLPWMLYIPLSLLTVTFTAYWSHRLMHRIPLFWNIHKVHHSVTNLNFTTSVHAHFLELLVHTPTHLFTVLLLGTDLVAPFGIIWMTIDYLAHSNIRVDMGRLTYVVCTPQAHRVHHSTDPQHYDRNFGNTFMWWDHVFGTFYYDPEHPPTSYGINEHMPTSFMKQQVLPLVWISRDVRGGMGRLWSRLRQPTPQAPEADQQ
jgi:sterol desaturase/sphingolipid hydroxylase (fatty acid hydroxylase superfamily)